MAERGQKAVKATNQLPADTIILGFTGSIGSGCSYIAEGIEKHYKYKRYVLSDILRKLAKERRIPHPTTENLQDIGDELRASKGNSVLVSKLFESIDTFDLKSFDGIIIDSIRNDGEVYVLRQFPYFFLFSIHAEKEIRRGRSIEKDKRFRNDREFDLADERDKAEDYSFGQQVEICNYLSGVCPSPASAIVKQGFSPPFVGATPVAAKVIFLAISVLLVVVHSRILPANVLLKLPSSKNCATAC
jgi:dephospho-CoA kinase